MVFCPYMTTLSVASRPTRVLYVAGAGRSGGTILSSILGQQPGYFYAGELRDLWTSGLRTEKMCGCGRRVEDCEVWQAVFDRAFGGLDRIDTAEMVHLTELNSRTRHLGAALWLRATHRPTTAQKLYLERLEALYAAIRDVTECRVIIDASRLIPYGLFISAVPNMDLRVLHLVRNPYAVAFSWSRRRSTRTATREVQLRRQGAVRSALDWNAQNMGGEVIWRRISRKTLMLRYEDIVADPAGELGRVAAMMDERQLRVAFSDSRTVNLRPNHSVAGNAYRMQTGMVALNPDNEWHRSLLPGIKRLVTLLCWPGLIQYGYLSGSAR